MIRVRDPQPLRQLHLGVAKIVMTNESADETNHDHGGGTAGGGRNRLHCFIGRMRGSRGQVDKDNKDREQQHCGPTTSRRPAAR